MGSRQKLALRQCVLSTMPSPRRLRIPPSAFGVWPTDDQSVDLPILEGCGQRGLGWLLCLRKTPSTGRPERPLWIEAAVELVSASVSVRPLPVFRNRRLPGSSDTEPPRVAARSPRPGPAWGHVVAKQLAQPFGAVAGLVVDDLCVVGVFAFVFLVLAWVAAGFEVASFDWRACSSCACFSTAAALAGSVLIVTPPPALWAYAAPVARDIRRIKPILFMFASQALD